MKINQTHKLILLFFITLIISSCSGNNLTSSSSCTLDTSLPRADSRYIGWLEKESIFRKIPEKIRIVSGTNFAWNFSSSPHDSKIIHNLSPIWLSIDTKQLNSEKPVIKSLVENTNILQKSGILGLYIYPTKSASFESLYSFHLQSQKENSPISLGISKEIGTVQDILSLQNSSITTIGNILPLSLGIGSDFLLALHGVREYPGLFVMQEVPKEFWHVLPTSNAKNFEPQILDTNTLKLLQEYNILPASFYRDGFNELPTSGFAVSNEILGYDGITRRFIYRFINSPYQALLNVKDPSMNTQRLLHASIIEEIGLTKQALVSYSIADLIGQEPQENTNKPISLQEQSSLALHTNTFITNTIHGYGAWGICQDILNPELLAYIQQGGADFVADSFILPALEKALITENNAPLITAFNTLKKYNIQPNKLAYGTQNVFLKNTNFSYNSSTDLSFSLANITDKEIQQLAKILENPIFIKGNEKLFYKFQQAQQIQYAFHAFQNLLPGISFISANELTSSTAIHFTQDIFTPSKNSDLIIPITTQLINKQSLLHKLQKIWKIKQDYKLSSAKIISVLSSSNPAIFAYSFVTEDNKKGFVAINLTKNSQKTILQDKINAPHKKKSLPLKPYGVYYKIY